MVVTTLVGLVPVASGRCTVVFCCCFSELSGAPAVVGEAGFAGRVGLCLCASGGGVWHLPYLKVLALVKVSRIWLSGCGSGALNWRCVVAVAVVCTLLPGGLSSMLVGFVVNALSWGHPGQIRVQGFVVRRGQERIISRWHGSQNPLYIP